MAVVTDASGATRATGRRKEAVVRVRLLPGTGQWKLNNRTLGEYFPNKVHQQIVAEPLKTLELAENYDVYATLRGGGILRPGRCAAPRHRPGTHHHRRGQPARPEEGRLPHPDARVKERKKYGLKKARKAPQYSKR